MPNGDVRLLWKPEKRTRQDWLIKILYQEKGWLVPLIAECLNRSETFIRQRVRVLGLKRSEDFGLKRRLTPGENNWTRDVATSFGL